EGRAPHAALDCNNSRPVGACSAKSAVPHGWLILSLQSDCFCCWCGGRELVRHQRRHERRESKWKCVAFKASRLPHDPEQSKPGTKKGAPKVRPPSLQFQTRLISSD